MLLPSRCALSLFGFLKNCGLQVSPTSLLVFLTVILTVPGFSQSLDPLSQAGQNQSPDCSDPTMAASPQCETTQISGSAGSQSRDNSPPVNTPVLKNSPETAAYQKNSGAISNPSQVGRSKLAIRPQTEFEQMVADSVGRALPLFGQSFFLEAPSTFAPLEEVQVPGDYVIGPGDELQINVWGEVQASLRVIVDRSGQIYVPQVGQISVAGVHYENLEEHLKREVSRIFKNFNLTANLGRLHSIQVLVVGDARYPGTYTISSMSSLVNAIFASGGPSVQGSLRRIQVRRDGTTITDFDFYDLLIKGDKSKDVHLQSGDVLYIPHVGPLVAISGSVNVSAIYEMKEDSTLQDLIETAGSMSTMADSSKIVIDRVMDHQARATLEFPLDDRSRTQPVRDGDIVRVLSIVPRFEDTVTLRGNVANPGRYPWKPGMRVTDLIPNVQALLTRGYWRNRADVVTGRATEYPIREELQNTRPDFDKQKNNYPTGNNRASDQNPPVNDTQGSPSQTPSSSDMQNVPTTQAAMGQNSSQNFSTNAGMPSGERNRETSGASQRPGGYQNPNAARNIVEDFRSYAPEINWDYAIIQRVNPQDLSSKLIWLSPRKAILERDEKSNLELQAGDIVTIFSQRDISVPQTQKSQYVIIEGEVARPGVYKLEANETLRSILQRAGGLTPDAYVYGSQFTRESARVDQQKSLDELAQAMEVQVRQSAMSVAASSQSGDLPQMLAAQQAIIQQLRNTRASGRVALPLQPKDSRITDFPDMVLEDNDHLSIPHMPSTVSVVGDVYNPGSFIFEPRNSAGGYLEMAGKGKPQSDLHHAFVLRANGVVVAASNVNGLFTGDKFERIHLYPGDQIVVPYKLPTGSVIRALRDWTQITSQIALTAAALAVIQ